MTDYLARAIEYLGAEPGEVVKHRVQGDEYIVILDKGIAGCPKYHIPLSKLDEPAPVPAIAVEADDLGVYGMSYRGLQAEAKALGIPAVGGKDKLAAEVAAALYVEEEE
jgi:hypothetical protein